MAVATQWNTAKPAMGNQVSSDIPDIEENFEEIQRILECITNGTLGTTNSDEYEVDVVTSGAIGPTGRIIIWTTNTPPTGYLECNGAAISRTTYATLFAAISDDYGVGDGSTTFNLPDLRGKFPRGWDHGAGTDPDAATRTDRGDGTTGDNIGTKQADEFKAHVHTVPYRSGAGAIDAISNTDAAEDSDKTTSSTGGNETRPININIMYCIKY